MPGLFLYQVETPITQSRHPATDGFLGRDHGATVADQHPDRRRAFLRKQQALRAAEEESHPMFALAALLGGDAFGMA